MILYKDLFHTGLMIPNKFFTSVNDSSPCRPAKEKQACIILTTQACFMNYSSFNPYLFTTLTALPSINALMFAAIRSTKRWRDS